MIGISKYEGHTPAPWHIENEENDGMRLFICSKDATILWQCETTHTDALLVADAPLILDTYKRLCRVYVKLGEENKKQLDVLSTLDEMIRNEESHVEMMKALEQGLDLPETWKEMIE